MYDDSTEDDIKLVDKEHEKLYTNSTNLSVREELHIIIEQIQRDAVIYSSQDNNNPILIDPVRITNKIMETINKHYVSKHEILAKLNNKKARVDIELQFRDPADRQFYINALDMVLRILNVDKLEKELEKENIKEK